MYEGGLDKRSSLDSLQQALFFSVLTGKAPAVVSYDTDGKEGRFEYRIRTACQKAGVRYEVFRKRLLQFIIINPAMQSSMSQTNGSPGFLGRFNAQKVRATDPRR